MQDIFDMKKSEYISILANRGIRVKNNSSLVLCKERLDM